MAGITRRQLLADYLDATDNEIAVDQMLLSMAHTTPERVGYMPRVSRWVGKAKRYPFLSSFVWRLLWVLWIGGGAGIFFTIELLHFEKLRKRSKKQDSKDTLLSEGAVLALSSRVCDVISPEIFSELPTAWLTCPWAPQHTLPRGAQELKLMAHVKRGDLLNAYRDAVYASYFLALDSKKSNWSLQSYTAFRWFMVRRVVDRISGKLVMAEHFDRWAVLVDRSVQWASRQALPTRLVLIQHGALGGLSDGSHAVSLKSLPTRLASVQELHVYNTKEEQVFRASVLTESYSIAPLSVHYFKPSITLCGSLSAEIPRILFVGHPLCEDFQVSVYKALHAALSIKAFYKPHPKAPMSAAMANVGWEIIKNPSQFPRVEMLISYPSTLVVEYEGVGIHASVHSIDIKSDLLGKFLDRTLGLLMQKNGVILDSTLGNTAQ